MWVSGAHPGTRSAVKITTYVSSLLERPGGLVKDSQSLMWKSF